MNHILRPLPFVLASTNIGTMIINHCDRHSHPVPNPANEDKPLTKQNAGGGGQTNQTKQINQAMKINQIAQVLV